LTLVANARPVSQRNSLAENKGAPLELKLSTHVPRICLNAALPLVLEITNAGQGEIKIYKPDLWGRFDYSSLGSEIAGSSTSCGFWDDDARNWAVLAPSAKLFETFIYMTEGSYFKAAGTYRLSTTLPYYTGDKQTGRIRSSEVEFEIYDCAAK
jgi:hypothetical protein